MTVLSWGRLHLQRGVQCITPATSDMPPVGKDRVGAVSEGNIHNQVHDRTGSIRKASSWSRNLPDQFPRFEKHFPRWKEQTGGFRVVSLLDDLKDTCTVHQKYKQLDFYNSYGERGFPHCTVQLFSHFFTATFSWTGVCHNILSGVCVSYLLLSAEVLQECCVQSLFLNMLPAGCDAEDTECA